MEFIDDNHVKGELSDEELEKQVAKIAETRDTEIFGRDGVLVAYEEEFEYKGIPYLIKIIRYFQIGAPMSQVRGMNPLGKWAVLEPTKELEALNKYIRDHEDDTGVYEWFYQDTLHYWQEKWTLKQMVQYMHESAKKCVEEIPVIVEKLRMPKEIKNQLDELVTKMNRNPRVAGMLDV